MIESPRPSRDGDFAAEGVGPVRVLLGQAPAEVCHNVSPGGHPGGHEGAAYVSGDAVFQCPQHRIVAVNPVRRSGEGAGAAGGVRKDVVQLVGYQGAAAIPKGQEAAAGDLHQLGRESAASKCVGFDGAPVKAALADSADDGGAQYERDIIDRNFKLRRFYSSRRRCRRQARAQRPRPRIANSAAQRNSPPGRTKNRVTPLLKEKALVITSIPRTVSAAIRGMALSSMAT